MAFLINDDCLNCGACESVCPNDAISVGDDIYIIDPNSCTECVDSEEEPRCQYVCPVACIPLDPDHVETHDELVAKLKKLRGE